MSRLSVFAASLLVAAASSAQPVAPADLGFRLGDAAPDALPGVTEPPTVQAATPSRVSSTGAILLSVGATAIPLGLAYVAQDSPVSGVLVLGGLALGPSAGNLAQGRYLDASIGTGIRAVGMGAMVYSLHRNFLEPESEALLLAGGAALLAGGLYDIVTAERATQHVRIMPTADLRSGAVGGSVRVGL